jgi:hypothetical protein
LRAGNQNPAALRGQVVVQPVVEKPVSLRAWRRDLSQLVRLLNKCVHTIPIFRCLADARVLHAMLLSRHAKLLSVAASELTNPAPSDDDRHFPIHGLGQPR